MRNTPRALLPGSYDPQIRYRGPGKYFTVGNLNHGDEVARIGALLEVPAANIDDAATHHPLVGGQAARVDVQLPGNLLHGTLFRPLRKLCPRKEGIGMLGAKRDAQANQEGKKHCTEAYRRYPWACQAAGQRI